MLVVDGFSRTLNNSKRFTPPLPAALPSDHGRLDELCLPAQTQILEDWREGRFPEAVKRALGDLEAPDHVEDLQLRRDVAKRLQPLQPEVAGLPVR